jgi:hypothetical protein
MLLARSPIQDLADARSSGRLGAKAIARAKEEPGTRNDCPNDKRDDEPRERERSRRGDERGCDTGACSA